MTRISKCINCLVKDLISSSCLYGSNKNMVVHLGRTVLAFLVLCRLFREWVVIMAQELSMHWASDFSLRSCSRWYLADRFSLEHKHRRKNSMCQLQSKLSNCVQLKVVNNCIFRLQGNKYYKIQKVIPSPSSLPYLFSDLLYYTLQKGSHPLNKLPLLQQLSVHLIMQPLRGRTFHSAGHRTNKKERYSSALSSLSSIFFHLCLSNSTW